jgi:hypothetical protein
MVSLVAVSFFSSRLLCDVVKIIVISQLYTVLLLTDDASERFDVLGQTDGNATIPQEVQLDLTTSAIAHVASRVGIPLAELEDGCSTTSGSGHLLPSWVVVASAAAIVLLSLVTSFS